MKRYQFPVIVLFSTSIMATVLAGQYDEATLIEMAQGGMNPAMLQQLAAKQAAAAGAKGAQPAAESPRLQRLKQLQFDRKPSSILKAWATIGTPAAKMTPSKPSAPATPEAATKAAPAAASPVAVKRATKVATPSLPPGAVPAIPGAAATAAAAAAVQPDAGLETELAEFQRNVTLGNWAAVKSYLAGLPEEEGKAGYRQMLTSLRGQDNPLARMFKMRDPEDEDDPSAGQQNMYMQYALMQNLQQQMMVGGGMMEKNVFSVGDVHGLAAAAPRGLDREATPLLGGILQQAIRGGSVIEQFVALMKAENAKPKAAVTKRQTAQILMNAEQSIPAGEFLPTIDEARGAKDREGLNLLARHYLARQAKEKKATHLEQAWMATQGVLALGESTANLPFPPSAYEAAGILSGLSPAIAARGPGFVIAAQTLGKSAKLLPPLPLPEKDEALRRAVELAPKVRKELGEAWLAQSFTSELQRGKEILATIGSVSAQGLQQHMRDSDFRLKQIKLQKTAVDAFLKAAPDKASQWRDVLSVLAGNWLREAEITYQFARDSTLSPYLQRDRYGNIYYMSEDFYNPYMQQQRQLFEAISTGEMLENRPGETWLGLVEDGLKPKLAMVFAQLYLKVSEETKAFPYIEQLSKTHPTKAKALVSEFLRVWTKNHDPNDKSRQTNRYMWMYGYEQRSEGIPLTRSKQERNLEELSGWVTKLRALPTGELNEELLAKAFTNCHSSAEVYRIEAINKVFGSLDGLKPKTLAALAQQMRGNLTGLWRNPAEQKDKKTNRKQKDIESEVLRGYAVAHATVDGALKKYPNEWPLHVAKAAILHDEINFQREVAKSAKFSKRLDEAMASFQRAAKLYGEAVKNLREDEETTEPYDQWFYASLGASDLGQITEERLPDLKQPALIRAAIQALPGRAAERHMNKFANGLFTRMSAAKPQVKFRYLKCGFEIVGDNKQAQEALKVFNYYKDIVSEIKFEAVIDGPDIVGHAQPFGVFINLRHTREIERESGGFGRYLQNQNSGMYWSYNYGRPTADYRDKFTEIVQNALKEHFEVLSVTFQDDKVHSRATREYGWRVTPYAYLLLKARDAKTDKIPSVHLDLDFLDTSGYVVIPVETPPVPIDARTAKAAPRPVRKLQLTQILDERQADKGKLVLEVKATGLGLAPDLDQILTLKPEGFDIVKTDDQKVSVAKFDPESDPVAVVSERSWMVTFQAKPDLPRLPSKFQFGTAKVDTAEMIYQRYEDADLATVKEVIDLEERYGRRSYTWVWIAVAWAVLAAAVMFVLIRRLRRPKVHQIAELALPASLTPFTVIGLLERIQRRNHLSEPKQVELKQSIHRLERHYFAEKSGNGQLDLKDIAEYWVRQIS